MTIIFCLMTLLLWVMVIFTVEFGTFKFNKNWFFVIGGVMAGLLTTFDIMAENKINECDTQIDVYKANYERASEERNRLNKAVEQQWTRDNLISIVARAAVENDIPDGIAMGLVKAESNWDYLAVSVADAYGLCQVTEIAATQMGRAPDGLWRFNPVENVAVGMAYLKWCYERTEKMQGDRWRLALYHYNWGVGKVRKWQMGEIGIPKSVLEYAEKIMKE